MAFASSFSHRASDGESFVPMQRPLLLERAAIQQVRRDRLQPVFI